MASVAVNTGPICADDPARDVPPEKWINLTMARRSAILVKIPHDCRSLIGFVDEADQFRMWERTGHADLADYVRRGLEIDPEMIDWARRGLEAFEKTPPKTMADILASLNIHPAENGAVPLASAVAVGKATAAQVLEKAPELMTASDAGKKGGRGNKAIDNINSFKPKGGTGADYLAARIKRDHPQIAAGIAAGEYPSIRAAAIAAGIVKVPTALETLQRAWKKASSEEQRQFLEWISNT